MEQLDANIERLRKLQHDSKELFKNGFAEKMVVDRTTVQLANLETQKITTQRSIDNGYIGLKVLLGMPVADSLLLTDVITEDKLKNGVLDVNSKNYQYSDRKEFQYLDAATRLNEYNVKRYKSTYLPTASLSSAFSKNAYRDQFNLFNKGDWYTSWNIGVNISVPLFLGFQRDASLKTAQLQWEQTKNKMSELKLNIDSEVEQAQNKYKAAILALDNQKQNMVLAESVYNQSKKKYDAGISSTIDITNAQTDLITAQTNYINAMYDAVLARIDYAKAVGKL
jgi:outer membrane protein TolC